MGARGGAGDCAQAEQVSVAFSVPFSDLSFILRDKAVRSTRPVFGLVFEPVFRVLKGGWFSAKRNAVLSPIQLHTPLVSEAVFGH